MNVLVDTSVWSLALRRRRAPTAPESSELAELVLERRALLLGAVRQELLSGIADRRHFEMLRDSLRAFPDIALEAADHEDAASFLYECRRRGVQGSNTDFLICAVAARRSLGILTTDADFSRFSKHLPITLHAPRA